MTSNDGFTMTFLNGYLKTHRLNGPAIINKNEERKEWYLNGKRHRLDGPSGEWLNGAKCWYKDGESHRDDGPAVEEVALKCWYKNGKRHRLDGPAIERYTGSAHWIEGKYYSEEEYLLSEKVGVYIQNTGSSLLNDISKC